MEAFVVSFEISCQTSGRRCGFGLCMLPQLTHLEENVGAVVDEEDERADPPEVDGPGAHHEADRRHVVNEHLPKNQTIYLAAKIRISQIRLD